MTRRKCRWTGNLAERYLVGTLRALGGFPSNRPSISDDGVQGSGSTVHTPYMYQNYSTHQGDETMMLEELEIGDTTGEYWVNTY